MSWKNTSPLKPIYNVCETETNYADWFSIFQETHVCLIENERFMIRNTGFLIKKQHQYRYVLETGFDKVIFHVLSHLR